MNNYYIYFHINPLKNEVFYVGKGQGKRAYLKDNRSEHWKRYVKKYGYIVDIVEDGLSEEEAFNREIFYIDFIGREDLGIGSLINKTSGGEGTSNILQSEDTKLKRMITREIRGIKPLAGWNKGLKQPEHSKKMKGKKHSDETKDKMKESQRIRNLIPKSDETKMKMRESALNRKYKNK